MSERKIEDRLLNAAERICDGLEPREHCATLMLDAAREIKRLEKLCESRKETLDLVTHYLHRLARR